MKSEKQTGRGKVDEFKVRESKHKLEPTRTGQKAHLFSLLLTLKLMKKPKENPEEARAAASLPAVPSQAISDTLGELQQNLMTLPQLSEHTKSHVAAALLLPTKSHTKCL